MEGRDIISYEVKSLSRVRLFAIPWTVAYQAPPSVEFFRQEYWSGLPFPSPGGLPDPGSNPGLPYCRHTLYHLSHQGSLLLRDISSSVGKEPACSAGDIGLIPGLGRPPGEGNGNPLQYPCLETPWTEKPGGIQSMGSLRYD